MQIAKTGFYAAVGLLSAYIISWELVARFYFYAYELDGGLRTDAGFGLLEHRQLSAALLAVGIAVLMACAYMLWKRKPRSPVLRRRLLAILFAGISVHALSSQLWLIKAGFNNKSVLWLAIFLLCAWFFDRVARMQASPGVVRTARILSGIFAACTVIGCTLRVELKLSPCFESPYAVAQTLMRILGFAALYAAILRVGLQYAITHTFVSAPCGDDLCRQKRRSGIWLAALIFLCWLPYWIIFYPGILSVDSITEIQSMLTMTNLSNHHPFIHQLTIRLFLLIGQRFNSVTLGVALYSLFQMAAMASIFAFTVRRLDAWSANRSVRLLLTAYYAFFMVNAYYSITCYKDVLFGGLTLLLFTLLLDEVRMPKEDRDALLKKQRILRMVCLILVSVLFCIYRNNGYYAFLLFLPFLLLCNRSRLRYFAVVGVSVVLLVTCYQHLIFHTLGVSKSNAGEMLSVPLQQIARTVRDHGDDIPEEERAVLMEVLPKIDSLGTLYIPTISDPVKEDGVFLSDVFSSDPLRYGRVWLHLGLTYPETYLTAFLCQNFGYWYPDEAYWVTDGSLQQNTLGLAQNPQWEWLRRAINETRAVQENTPVLAMLYSIGFTVWTVLICASLLLLKGRRQLASPFLLLAALWLTTLASPVHCEYRYLYGLIVSMPFCICISLIARADATAPGRL